MIWGQLDSGLRYAVKQAGTSVSWCSLSIRAGSRYEGKHHSGIAHFTEHCLFKGTSQKSARQINSYLDVLGGELNAFTTKEEIVLHATVLREDLPKAAGLLLELGTCATFPLKEIETEKGVVIDEINSYKDSPADEIYDKSEEMFFEGHPLGKSILGRTSSVKKISSEELGQYYKERFCAGNMALSIVSPEPEKKMEMLVKKLCAKYPPPVGDTSAEDKFDSPVLNFFDKVQDKRNHEANAVIACAAPSLFEGKDRFTAILLSNILGGPASNSVLNSILREKYGWVYGIECSYTQYLDGGIMAITLGCERENLDKCLKAVHRAISSFQTSNLTEKKLKAAKRQILGQLAISSENGETQCLSMGKSMLAFGKIATDAENRNHIDEISPDDIREMTKRIFDPARISRLVYL